jgi:hypothetical protein
MRRSDPHDDPAAVRTAREKPGPVPAIGQLRQQACWTWLYCGGCQRGAPSAFAPWIILFGVGASSDVIRRNARCAKCGHRGASLILPSHVNSQNAPFPVHGTWSPLLKD